MQRVAGGYLDLQINGGWGHHFSTDPSSIWEVGARLVEHGVTQFLPTLVSDGFPRLPEALAVLEAGPPTGWLGARPIGLHMEGPWLAPSRAGAHPRSALLPPDPSDLGGVDQVRLVTLAPELDGAVEVIGELVERGVVVSLGHSDTTAADAALAFDAGATMGTHLFNAMSGLNHRSPGLAAALLLDPRAFFGIIADGHHVDPAMVRLAWQTAGPRLVLVSDAVALLGRGDEVARLADGTLAGSTIGLDRCVRNLVAFAGATMAEAAAAASTAPRSVLGLPPPADTFVDLDDDGVVQQTVIDGALAYTADAHA